MRSQVGEPLLFVIVALATWRVTALVAYEQGPFGVLGGLRRLMVRLRLGQLVACFHCLGFWVAGVAALVVYGVEMSTLLFWLAIAGSVSIVERWLGGGMTNGAVDDV